MKTERQTGFNEFVKQVVPEEISFCPGPDGLSSELLSSGIVNHNLKVYLAPEATPAVLSIYSSNGKERVDREIFTRSLLGEGTSLPIQRIFHSGYGDTSNGKEYGFLIKEFKTGDTLNDVLQNMVNEKPEDDEIGGLINNLGKNLNILGSIKMSKFGKIVGNNIIGSSENCSWKDYYSYRLNKRIKTLEDLDPNNTVGEYKVKDILILTPKLSNYAETQSGILETVKEPRFVHNDFHFLNILASQESGTWQISGILDLENATAGDPEFDLISIESQLNLSPEYRGLFLANLGRFKDGYKNPISNEYLQKRGLYHLTWSLSYFEAVMQMDTNLHPVNSQVNRYMKGHYETLKSLADGKSLEEIGVPSLC